MISSKNFYLWYESAKKPDEKKGKEDKQTNFGRFKFNSLSFASKVSASTNQLH